MNADQINTAPLVATDDFGQRSLSSKRPSPGRYTARVRKLRVVLPLAAVVVLAVVFIWPHFDPAQAPKRHAEVAPPQMTNSEFTGVDRHNRPFTITSTRAVQKNTGSNDIDLTQPVADIVLQNGRWVSITARQGEYREDPGLITLEGDVRLNHDAGYEFRTEAAALDLANNVAWSDKPTSGYGPRGEIQGDSFRMMQEGDKIIFTGKCRLLLRPDDEPAASAEPPAGVRPGAASAHAATTEPAR